ncbi:hypothetical protein HC891_13260 [Candidatus Gracilibacteria bacterium]|nr:hypothetical protein [Candidatus Gracilibacteria bacterium]
MHAFGGLWAVMPGYTRMMLVVLLAAIGLPGLSGFIGEYMLMQGALIAPDLGGWFAAAATIGLIFAAAYMLRMFRIVFMGSLKSPGDAQLPDLNRREWITLGALALPLIALGLFPNLIFGVLAGSVDALAQQFDTSPPLSIVDSFHVMFAKSKSFDMELFFMNINELTEVINKFVTDKGWYAPDSAYPQTPRNIAVSVAVEAAEILEHFQFGDTPKNPEELAGELADVANYLFQLAYLLNIDLEQAILAKLKVNYDRTWE